MLSTDLGDLVEGEEGVVVNGGNRLQRIIGGAPGSDEAVLAATAPDGSGSSQGGGLAGGGAAAQMDPAAFHTKRFEERGRQSRGDREHQTAVASRARRDAILPAFKRSAPLIGVIDGRLGLEHNGPALGVANRFAGQHKDAVVKATFGTHRA